MFKDIPTFSGFSVNDLAVAKSFYVDTLGLEVADETMGLTVKLGGGGTVFIYDKPDHVPATFTILNFVVTDIDKTINELDQKGITMERYDAMPAPQDEKGVLRGLAASMGPDIAWFKDPAGNVLSVLQDK